MIKCDSKDFSLRYLRIGSLSEAVESLKRIGVDAYGIEAMKTKMLNYNLLIEGVDCKIANIIKQEMLALGGDAAVSRGTVSCSIPETDVIIIGTLKQLYKFADKIDIQPFGLKNLSMAIRTLLSTHLQESILFRTINHNYIIKDKTLLMGILNVTPDSFSDGGMFKSPEMAVERGLKMEEEGADIIDIGGESSRPGALPVSVEEELRRVMPVLKGLARHLKIPISIDTTKPEVAKKAIEHGAEIINDISAMTFDQKMREIVVESGAAVILMHMRGTPRNMQQGEISYKSVSGDIAIYLKEKMESAINFGVDSEKIIIDPGFGFGKTSDDNLKLLKNLKEFKFLGRPIMVGVSRKAFIGNITGGIPAERLEGTSAAVTAAVMNGANIIRAHDVKEIKKVISVADAIIKA